MSGHTKGPWDYWSGYNPYDQMEAQVTADGGEIVIACYNHLISEAEENARLIAAAPDLLDALQRMVKNAQKQAWSDKYPADMDAAYTAIKKALAQ